MELNYIAIIIATAGQFIFGAIWYSLLFGKLWAKIHNCDNLSKEELKKMQKAMGPFYALQGLMTLLTTFILAIFIAFLPHNWNVYALAAFFWAGFVVPTQVSAVIFGEQKVNG